MEYIRLSNGVDVPGIGFGTWQAPENEVTKNAVKLALETGYRHIDAASRYYNEQWVGEGMKASGVKREEIFLTGKLWNNALTYDDAIREFEKSITDLKTEYLDLYLIHWPRPVVCRDTYIERNVQVWKAMEDLYKDGKIKAIGVSNFKVHHMEELMERAEITPMVNQIEFHPGFTQPEVVDFCKRNGIAVEAYSPLSFGGVFKCPELLQIAEEAGVDVAKLCYRYVLQKGIITLTKSVTPERIVENRKLDFTLSEEVMAKIDAVTTCEGRKRDSDEMNF